MKRVCPPLKLECRDNESGDGFWCEARVDGDRLVGEIDLLSVDDEPSLLAVRTVMLRRSDEKRCGIGTKLYERAAEEACKRGMRLSSDISRTKFSEGFWKKQVQKGRAECAYTQRKGRRGATMLSHSDDEGFNTLPRRWRCRRYVMKSCGPAEAKIDLSGTTKRIVWRGEPVVKKTKKRR